MQSSEVREVEERSAPGRMRWSTSVSISYDVLQTCCRTGIDMQQCSVDCKQPPNSIRKHKPLDQRPAVREELSLMNVSSHGADEGGTV